MIRSHVLLIAIFTYGFFVNAQVPCGSGYKSNGVNDFINIPDSDNINLKVITDRTIEFWFKTSDITTRQIIFEEGGGSKALMFFLDAGEVYCGGITSGPNQGRFFRSAFGEILVDTWYHIAMTIETSTAYKWFLNGVEQDSQTGFEVGSHTGNISLARSDANLRYPPDLLDVNWPGDTYSGGLTPNNNDDNFFAGSISLFRIWNVARTPTQINDNKLSYLTTGTSLIAYQTEGDKIMYEPSGAGTSIASTATADGSGTTYTWTGGTSTVWTTDTNWSGTSPLTTKTQTVVINSGSNDPSITTEVNIGRLTVGVGAELTIQIGGTLHVYSKITNNGTITVEEGGSLIYHPCNSSIVSSNNFNIKRDSPNYSISKEFSYWSSPLLQADADPGVIFPSSPVIWYFDASVSSADWAYNSGANFIPGVGYAVRSESTGISTKTFTGDLNEGEISAPIYFNSNLASTQGTVWSTAGDNLLGNPYTAALDWDVIIQDEANDHLEGDVYYWDQTSVLVGDNDVNDYKQYNLTGGTGGATGNIGSGQGFFIRTTDASPSTFTFKPTYQKAGANTQFYKSSTVASKKLGRSWFLLKKEGLELYSSTLIGFVKGATNDF
ncbi:MAG: LamG domain-containing protein, partial [Flavobacteriaceae bacterium]|nr:LamG domain-containing protein [Flavobacteriaceae bacterium]